MVYPPIRAQGPCKGDEHPAGPPCSPLGMALCPDHSSSIWQVRRPVCLSSSQPACMAQPVCRYQTLSDEALVQNAPVYFATGLYDTSRHFQCASGRAVMDAIYIGYNAVNVIRVEHHSLHRLGSSCRSIIYGQRRWTLRKLHGRFIRPRPAPGEIYLDRQKT